MYLKRKNKLTAFTLIELLIAVTIFSVVASLLYSSFRLGIISWKRTEANLSRYQKIRYAMNRLSEDITNTFMHKKIVFKGQEKRIEFAGVIKGKDKQKSIGKICYFFSGEGASLLRQKLSYDQAIKEETTTEGGEDLISDVIDFKINYCYKEKEEESEFEWFPEWVSEKAIPQGVKLELTLKDDYAPDGKIVFVKRINIPVGEMGNLEELKK